MTRADDIYVGRRDTFVRLGIPAAQLCSFPLGNSVRDWAIAESAETAIFPYDQELQPVPEGATSLLHRFLWRYRTQLWERREPNGNHRQIGLTWFEWSRLIRRRRETPLSIAFAKVTTHNHFVLDRGHSFFSDGSPVIKLPVGSTEQDHLALLGILNSSTGCFWMKQVFHNKGIRGQGGGLTVTDWEQFYEFDATKAKLFPVTIESSKTTPYATKIDALANARSTRSVRSVVDAGRWSDGRSLREALDDRRAADFADLTQMVALQEELDWLCYALYGLDAASDLVAPDKVEPCPPTWLPWNLMFAERDAINRAALARGEEPNEQPSEWWNRHRWEALTALPSGASPALTKRVEARKARVAATPALALIESTNFKRRWYKPDYIEQEGLALSEWLAERVEHAGKARTNAFSLEQLVANLQDDPRVLAVCEVLTGRKDFSLSQVVAGALQGGAVPNHRFHLYKPSGLVKGEVWQRTWAEQRREDAGEKVTPEVPPSYGTGDFLKPDYWRLRGKLDVPKERFIAFTEVPGRSGVETLYGWAGWTAQQRVKAILAIDEQLEDASLPLAGRIGLLDSAWRLLPDVARDDASAAARLKAELQALVGPEGPSRELVEDWKKRFPPPTARAIRTKRAAAARDEDESDNEESDES